MNKGPLKYVSVETLNSLSQSIPENIARYESGDFRDLTKENGWSIETATVTVDYDRLTMLDGKERSAAADIKNSLILYEALSGMTPALAREERIWARLAHVECLDYARARWLEGATGPDLEKAIRRHMFAPTRTGIRDDHALARLWWNVHIATIADPDNPKDALQLILRKADIRSSFVERPRTTARRPLARAIVRAMRKETWVSARERVFRDFMMTINKHGGGILFESLDESEVDQFVGRCLAQVAAIHKTDGRLN